MTEAKRGPVRDRQRAAETFFRWAIDLRPLRIPAYRRMWLGNPVSMYGYQFTAVAVPFQMYALTEDSFWVGLLGVAGLVPLLVFGLWGGSAADAVDRRRLLLSSSALAWLATLGLLAQALLEVGSPVLLLGLVAVQSAAFAVSSPTRSAIIPRLVPAELVPANTAEFHDVPAQPGLRTAHRRPGARGRVTGRLRARRAALHRLALGHGTAAGGAAGAVRTGAVD